MSVDKNGFVPMYDLADLNEDQRQKYYRDACAFFGVPDNLNLLAFIKMVPDDNSKPRTVLYAKKGATDLIRQNKGITTVELELTKGIELSLGIVSFTAVGKDESGRIERAVGVISIDGLRGKALASAIMTAQTRATRRMTLQFVGGGILDETEVESGQLTTSTGQQVALDAIQVQPTVVPSDVSGRDITEPTDAQKGAQEALAAVKPEILATAAGEHHATVADLAKALPPDNPLVQAVTAAAEAPKQRKRKPANEVTLNTPAQEAEPKPVTAGSSVVEHPADNRATVGSSPTPPTTPVPAQVSPAVLAQVNSAVVAQPVQPAPVQKLLNEAEEKEVRDRLGKYRNEILPGKPPAGGAMVPTEGIGGVEIKLRSFVSKFNPNKPSSKTWNYGDWKLFLDYLDAQAAAIGAVGLVDLIDKKIGAKK